MADNSDKYKGSITENADSSEARINEISNVNRTISQMQRKIDSQMQQTMADTNEYEQLSEVQGAMIKVLKSMSGTVASIGKGFTGIATATAKSGRDAISQYTRAISQDINVNKQNLIASALSKTTPLFGYFAAKFVETDVFKSAASRMKSHLTNALGDVTSKLGTGIKSLFSRNRTGAANSVSGIKVPKGEKIPKMAVGGYVEKTGLVKLHAGEVVAPIEKILSRIDESISTTKELADISKTAQLKSMARLNSYVGSVDSMQKVGLFKGFMKAMREVETQYREPSNVRMLRAVLAIQDKLGATIGTWEQVYRKMLLNHPTFRNIMFALKNINKAVSLPFKAVYQLFKVRGGYKSHLSRAGDPQTATAENVGMLYAGTMWRLDNLLLYTKATAEATRDMSNAITGIKYPEIPGIKRGVWSFFGLGRTALNWSTKMIVKGVGEAIGMWQTEEGRKKTLSKFDTMATKLTSELWGMNQLLDLLSPWRKQVRKTRSGLVGVGGEASTITPVKVMAIEDAVNDSLPWQGMMSNLGIMADKLIVDEDNTQKLIGYTKAIAKSTEASADELDTANDRERRKSIFGGVGGIFRSVTSIIGKFLPFLLMLKTQATGFLSSIFTNVFTKGAVGKLLSSVGTALSSAAPMLGTVATWVGGVAAAGAAGWFIGKGVDKLFGISDKFQAKLDEWDAKANALSNIVSEKQGKIYDLMKSERGTEVGFTAGRTAKLLATIHTDGKMKSVGTFGRANISEIEDAQRNYMMDNISEYLKYDPDQLKMARAKWTKQMAGTLAKMPFTDAAKYGAKREAMFLQYAKKNLTELSAVDIDTAQKEYMAKAGKGNILLSTAEGTVTYAADGMKKVADALTETYIEGVDMARRGAEDFMAASGPIVSELAAQGKKLYNATETAGEKAWQVGQQNVQATIVTAQNNSNRMGENMTSSTTEFSPRTARVVAGAVNED